MSPAAGETTIAVLPEVVQNQIAAGEVVERPASVVKELVENALDAGATHVRVDLEEGGAKLVRVVDDGVGMGAADLALSLVPHATSKLRSPEDLDHIASLGFRGEALASIASVGRALVRSVPRGASTGHEVTCDGGRTSEVREAGGAAGTTIEVRDLFYNTPARRRFLKRTSTELGRCLDVVQRLALAHEGVGFVVTHDGRRAFDVEPGMDLRARVRRAFGADMADSLVEVEARDGDVRLAGLVAPPRLARRDTSRQMWFLNGRSLRDKVLVRAIREAFRGWLMEGRHPAAFLHLSMDPALVDVNVHPQKSEVRFRQDRRLFGFLVRALREAVARTDVATPGERLLGHAERRGAWQPREEHPGQTAMPDPGPRADDGPRVYEIPAPPGGGAAPTWDPPAPVARDAATDAPQDDPWHASDDLRGPYLQVDKTYLVRPLPDGFEVIDQHALHERLTLNGLRADVAAKRVEVQRLLVPELVEVSRSELKLLEPHAEALAAIGLEVAPFGETTVAVQGVPALLRNPDVEGVVRDVLAVLEETGRPPGAEEVVEEVLHRMACLSSIMAGDRLDDSEIRALLERAREFENDQTCAHGRPTRVRFTLEDLEKAFHRR